MAMQLKQVGFSKIGGAVILLGGLCVGPGALAGGTQAVKTPLGTTIQAEVVSNPPEGSIEKQIIESLKLIRDGQFDKWMDTYCYPSRCDSEIARAQMKNFNLSTAKKSVAKCLQADDSIWVTSRKGDPAKDEIVKVFISCGENRMPAPSSHNKLKGKWYVSQFSW
jgi:hypothetical protein